MKSSASLKKTPFYSQHIAAGGKMVSFAGYELPVQYEDGILQEHLHTRDSAGLFDVSHMGQILVSGDGVATALEQLIPTDLDALLPNQQVYALLTDENGGILDDLIITRWSEDCFFLVVNAARKNHDIAHLRSHLKNVEVESLDNYASLALQGPGAKDVMRELAPAATELVFMNGCRGRIGEIDVYITRSGYTGEDGFEISVPGSGAQPLVERLLAFKSVKWVGLGARDTLRLEAGLCLYGHDMDLEISPIEAGLTFAISRSRRVGGDKEGGFPGSGLILEQLASGISRKRVGLMVDGKAPVREGAEIIGADDNVIGKITSGGYSPTLQVPIAMGYVPIEYSNIGARLSVRVRGKPRSVTVAKMPFVSQRYYRG